MARSDPPLTSFNAGELSPYLRGRVDDNALKKYFAGCDTLFNMIARVQGPAIKRPGTQYAGRAKDITTARLIPFQANNNSEFVFEIGGGYIRFWDAASRQQIMVDGSGNWFPSTFGTPAELTPPISGGNACQTAQANDLMWLVTGTILPRKIKRIKQYQFTESLMGDGVHTPMPFKDLDPLNTITIGSSGTTGNVQLNATGAVFAFGASPGIKVGEVMQLQTPLVDGVVPWEVQKAVTSVGDYRSSNGRNYTALNAGIPTGTQRPIHSIGARFDGIGGIQWSYHDDNIGEVAILSIDSATQAQVHVTRTLPAMVTLGTTRWARGAWNDDDGYPNSVAIFRERLCFARGQTIWTSVAGDYENFTAVEAGIVAPDLAVTLTIAAEKNDRIKWLANTSVLIAGTANGPHAISESSTNEPFGPANLRSWPIAGVGCSDVLPCRVGANLIFVQAGGRAVREIAYDLQSDGYTVDNDLTIFADHVAPERGFTHLTYAKKPDPIIWFAGFSDTDLFHGCTYDRGQQVVAWHRHQLGGDGGGFVGKPIVLDVCAVMSPDGVNDDVWVLTSRFTTGAAAGRYLEVLGPGTSTTRPATYWAYDKIPSIKDASYLDFSKLTSVLSNGGHLPCTHIPAGSVTQALLEGYVIGDTVVDVAGMKVEPDANPKTRLGRVGFGYVSTLAPMPFHAPSQAGSSEGKRTKLVGVTVRVLNTVGFTFAGDLAGPFDICEMRTQSDLMDTAVSLKSGDYWVEPQIGYKGGKDDPQLSMLYLRQDKPLPLQVLAIFAKLEVGT